MEQKVKKIVADVLGYDIDEVSLFHHLDNDLGADALDRVEIIMELEKVFETIIEDDDFDNAKTVRDLVTIVNKSTTKKEVVKPKSKKTVKKRVIKFTEYTYDDGSVCVKPVTKGFNDFELVGLLSYYHDVFKVQMMQGNKKK